MIDPIIKSVLVPLTPQEAFNLFLSDLDKWWPSASHSVSGSKNHRPKLVIEPVTGGKILELGTDGTQHIWGTILGWDDGEYVSFTWHPGRSADEATVVSIQFSAVKEGCKVNLTHGGFDILGPQADAISTSYVTGWEMVLGCYSRSAVSQKAFA